MNDFAIKPTVPASPANGLLTGRTVTITRDYSEPWIDSYNWRLRHVTVDSLDYAMLMR